MPDVLLEGIRASKNATVSPDCCIFGKPIPSTRVLPVPLSAKIQSARATSASGVGSVSWEETATFAENPFSAVVDTSATA